MSTHTATAEPTQPVARRTSSLRLTQNDAKFSNELSFARRNAFEYSLKQSETGGDRTSPRLASHLPFRSRAEATPGGARSSHLCATASAGVHVCVCLPPTFIRAKQKMERSICCLVLVPSANVFGALLDISVLNHFRSIGLYGTRQHTEGGC